MLHYAAVFLVIGIIALLLGAGNIAGLSMQIAWILFIVFLVLAVLSMIFGGRFGKGAV